MINEASEFQVKSALDAIVQEENIGYLRKAGRFKQHTLSNFSLLQEDFQTIKIQLRALGLIAKSERSRSVKDSGTYWTLTSFGDEVMTRLRAIRSNRFEKLPGKETLEQEESLSEAITS
jgi:hypothetical protein